ncbi:MAG: dipeptidase [Bradymonadales bacterium]|nr:dipeptidase [Bradymonadales bacterium]
MKSVMSASWVVGAIGALLLIWQAAWAGPPESAQDGEAAQEPRSTRQLHFEAITVITHVDTPWHMLDDGFDVTARQPTGHLDLVRMAEGGVDAAFFVVWVDPARYQEEAAFDRAFDLFLAIHDLDWRSDLVAVADQVGEIRNAIHGGQAALLIGVEGGQALGTDNEDLALHRIRLFRALGARYLSIAWSVDNPLGHSSTGRHPERGLTPLGRQVVREMERIGLVVDVSHASDQTFDDILETVSLPVMASHSGVRALADHPRNLSDEMIRRIAEGGGIVCVNFFPDHLDASYANRLRRVRREHRAAFSDSDREHSGYTEQGQARQELARELEPGLSVPDIGDVADQIMHIVSLVGADAVCLGTDYDGIPQTPLGLADVSYLPDLSEELHRRGLPDHHLVKILGGNVLRVLSAWE